MNGASVFDERLRAALETAASQGMDNAARGLSGMIGETLAVTEPVVRLVPLAEVPALVGGAESEAVGIYLRAEGTLSGQIMLVLPYERALELVDLLLGAPVGATRSLGALECSALAEVGNLSGTFFLNAMAVSTHLEARPSPPAVMVDMVGAILDIIVASCSGPDDSVPMIRAAFLRGDQQVQADFWVIPEPAALQAFARQMSDDGPGT